ncbi:CoA ester lyase [Streptomyces albus]|nr:CoA ester lyase [Streptomyces albus]
MPGSDRRKIEKAAARGADEIVLDLEDSVAPAHKAAARDQVTAWLADIGDHPGRISVRVNAPGTPWCVADVEACAAAPRQQLSLVLPKVESAGDLAFVDRLLDGAEAAADRTVPLTVQALIETAAGLAHLDEIVTASSRLRAVVLGYADLAGSLGRTRRSAPDTWLPAQHQLLVAARTAGIAAVDGPFLGTGTGEDFQQSVRTAADLGFDGKWVIHPAQIKDVVAAFTPDEEELAEARGVLETLRKAHRRGAGAVALGDRMLDEALAVSARRTLTRAGVEA